MSYRSEFPNYDGNFYCPKGWVDGSWHNDTCPHIMRRYEYFGGKEITYLVWQDYADKAKREYENGGRYCFQIEIDGDIIFSHDTDDLEVVKKFMQSARENMDHRGFKILVGEE